MSDGIVPPHRRNGLSRPYSSTQVVGLVALLASVVEYALFVAPILHPCAIAPVTLVLAWVVGLAVQAAAQTILADPVDLHLCRHWRDMDHNHHNNHQSHDDQEQQQPQQQQPPSQQPNNYPTTALSYNALHNPLHRPKATRGMTWSDYLYWRVNGPRQDQPLPRDEDMKQCWICDTQVADHSMHCKFCNKCVYHFDHHCMCEFIFFWCLCLGVFFLSLWRLIGMDGG